MSNVITNVYKYESSIGNFTPSAASDYAFALLNDIFTPSSVDALSDINTFSGDLQSQWEASGIGYTSGGATLTGNNMYRDDTNNRACFSADDVSWTASTINAYGGVLYRKSDSMVICFIDFGQVKTSVAGNFDVHWNSAGIFCGQ
jgi:hypothetical protein